MNLLPLLVALMPLFSFSLAAPASIEALADKQELKIIYHKADFNITVQVLSGGSLVGQSCSSSLSSGSFKKLPIVFDVDERGRGNLTVGGSTYLIHENVTYSGGIVCGRMFNRAEAAVSCTVAVPADLPLQPLSRLDIAECIPNGLNSLAKTIQLATSPPSGPMDAGHSRRQVGPPGWHDPDTTPQPHHDPPCFDPSPPGTTQRDGDGDPHQNYHHLQLSVSDYCSSCPPAFVDRSPNVLSPHTHSHIHQVHPNTHHPSLPTREPALNRG